MGAPLDPSGLTSEEILCIVEEIVVLRPLVDTLSSLRDFDSPDISYIQTEMKGQIGQKELPFQL